MAIRKDLDDMLNNLKGSNDTAAPVKKVQPAIVPVHKPSKAEEEIDHMSVDDLLNSLSHVNDMAEHVDPMNSPEPVKKKRIVISGDLPDYEALRRAELEKDRAEAERLRLEAEKKAAEEAERVRLEAEKRAAEEAERARLEAERKAAEEAERVRLEAERKAAEEAERVRLEAEKRAAEEAQRKRIEAERKAAEEAERARLEAEKKAAEEAQRKRLEEAKIAAEEAIAAKTAAYTKQTDTPDKSFSFEEEINVVASSQTEDSLGGEPTVDELMAAAFAAVKAEAEADIEEATEAVAEQVAEAEQEADEIIETDPVGDMIDTIREDAEKKLSELEEDAEHEETDSVDSNEETDEDETLQGEEEEKSAERKKRFFEMRKANDEESGTEEEKPKGKITSALEKIMDEDPDEIIAERSEKIEEDEFEEHSDGKLKKRLYTIFGIVFAVLACIGLITVVATSAKLFRTFTSGNSKKSGFAEQVYPAVIMDIESFDEPSQLTSDQVITAAIWSMIMSDGTLDQYERTFDVVRVPAVDVESYAVKLFGENLPEITHTTVGPAESRFYYNEEKQSYNVPLTPVTFTYSPEIKSVTKSGSEYTVDVDYIDELPEWLPKTSSKSVQFKLTETSDGYQIKSMKVISENNNI